MVCVPPSVSLPASDSPSHYLTSDSILLPSRLTWYRYPIVLGQRDPAQSLAVDTLHKPEFRFPVEILDEIFSYATLPTLTRLALVSHTFQEVAARLLYRNIPSLPVSHTTALVETLASKPCLAAHTRTCEIGDMTFLDANRMGLLPPSFFEQLRSALHSMHRLTEAHLPPQWPHVPRPSWRTVQAHEAHRALRTAIFCGAFAEGVTLPADALPSLRRVTASPPTLACVVPGRSIREVDLCLVHPWSLNREVLQTTIRVISASKCPLDSLKIISHLSEPTDIVLSSLETIPSGLSSITKFALHAVSGSITDDILSGLPPILSRFTDLRSVVLFSKNRYDALHTAAGSRALAEAWHAHCSSLESVTLPGATYVHHRNYGWNMPRDLAELLETREQPTQPQHCAAAAAQGDKGRIMLRGFKSDLGMERNGGGASMVAVAA
ncbi:hypothetical protein EDB89DRAFT_2065452 [Lactarius sanguifluus]|nr:hypothetical protein EDB89DRAFT_2065452 [Lactarius sanguifluus]